MITAAEVAGALCAAAAAVQFASTTTAMVRLRRGDRGPGPGSANPGVSLIRPVCGLENFVEQTLHSGFLLDYPRFELIFCVADRSDPVVPLIERLIEAHPAVPARLLTGDDRLGDNPKLNNLAKGVRAATHDWLVFADSNVLMPRDYIQRMLAAWRPDTGLVCSPPSAQCPAGWWAEVEAGFLNSHQARWQYVADALGLAFAQGKTMFWRRLDLERIGGLEALASEVAEDAAATKAVRALGLKVRLAAPPFAQPLGQRRFGEVWRRQLRWAQLRRASFPGWFAAEMLCGGLPPLLAAGGVAYLAEWPIAGVVTALALAWYGSEVLLARAAGWPCSLLSPMAWLQRDLLMPALWAQAWFTDQFDWRGNAMRSRDNRSGLARAARELLARLTPS